MPSKLILNKNISAPPIWNEYIGKEMNDVVEDILHYYKTRPYRIKEKRIIELGYRTITMERKGERIIVVGKTDSIKDVLNGRIEVKEATWKVLDIIVYD